MKNGDILDVKLISKDGNIKYTDEALEGIISDFNERSRLGDREMVDIKLSIVNIKIESMELKDGEIFGKIKFLPLGII